MEVGEVGQSSGRGFLLYDLSVMLFMCFVDKVYGCDEAVCAIVESFVNGSDDSFVDESWRGPIVS